MATNRLPPININMRCIEIIAFYTLYRCHRAININMRCIEIRLGKKEKKIMNTD